MRAIFISYRRDDTEGYAGRLFQDLRERFGKDSVFMDVAGIEPGRDFRRVIEQQVASCGVLLAVIGKSWLTVVDQQGQRRLDDAYDFVRLETASALKRDIPVIPVLVQQAEMPRPEQLPEDLKDLAFRNSVELSHARWESDVELLIAALTRYIDLSAPTAATAAQASAPRDAPAASRHRAWVIAPLATLAIGGIGYAVWDRLIAGGDETKETAAPGVRMGAASAPELVRPTPIASAPAPPVTREPAPTAAQGPAPIAIDLVDREPATVHPAASPPATARRVERPVVAKAPAPVPVPAPAPAHAVAVPRPPPATATATTSPSLPISRAAEPATTAPSPPALAAPAPAVAESPSPAAPLARRESSLDLLGSPGSPSMVTRTIVIKPTTSYVNVTGGEVIRFEVGDKSFLWNFSGPGSSFDLTRVAPPSVLDHKVTAYIAPNPMYPRRR